MKTNVSILSFLTLGNAFLSSAALIDLGAAAKFGGLAPQGITNTGATVITGDLGTTGTSITGFPPGDVVGTTYMNDNTTATAQADSAAAFTQGQNLVATVDKASATLGGDNLTAGIYKYDGSVGLTGTLTLNGKDNSSSTWVFQIAKDLITSTSSNVDLVNGALASNVYWIIGSSATLGTYSTLEGNVLTGASIAAKTGATVNGGLYAGSEITLDSNTITV
ncbi:hypothetical protein BDV97DRAFT_378779 [Delphinella strobiligena]|nr:hypothetical protein BDV97DRAFT_378779 [Delphinella strobiligena]